jgi:hypothetical protein
MRRLQNRKKLLSLLMVTLMVLPFVIRTVHLETCHRQEDARYMHHNCTDCPVCCFAFSLFTETETFDIVKTVYNLNYKIFICDYEIVDRIIYSFNLRAPPNIFTDTLKSLTPKEDSYYININYFTI